MAIPSSMGPRNGLQKGFAPFELTKESVIGEISRTSVDLREAFQTILKNRTFHAGRYC